MTKTLESDAKVPLEVRMSEQERVKLESDIEKVKNRIVSLQEQKAKLENSSGNFGNLKQGFEGLVNSAKKLVLGIIGVRAAYSAIRKATSAYLNTDRNTTTQLESNWIALGSLMSGIIEKIVAGMKKVITAVLYFAQCLTGTNYIAKANAAILKKQTDRTNALAKANNKLTTSFDEMNIMQDNSSAYDVEGAEAVQNSLFDINDLSESARKSIEKIAEVLQPVYNFIKDIINWCVEHPDALLAILGGATLLSMLGKVIGIAGVGGVAGTGLAGVLGLLLAIAAIGTIVICIKTIVDAANDLKETNEQLRQIEEGSRRVSQQVAEDSKKFIDAAEKNSQAMQTVIDHAKRVADNTSENIKKNLEHRAELIKNKGVIALMTGELQANADAILTDTLAVYDNISSLGYAYEQGKLNTEQTEEYKKQMELFTGVIDAAGGSVDGLTKVYGISKEEAQQLMQKYDLVKLELKGIDSTSVNTKGSIGNFTKSMSDTKIQSDKTLQGLKDVHKTMDDLRKNNNVTMKVDGDTSKFKTAFNGLFSGLSTQLSSVFGFKLPTIRLAQGGIVNNPGRGVSLGRNIIAGEAGAEWVQPLDDPRSLEMIGQAIGEHININATIPVSIGNRQVAREFRKITAEDDFAYNR